MNVQLWSGIFILAGLWFCGCNAAKSQAHADVQAIPVVVQKVQYVSSSSILSVSGNIEGNKTVKLGFMVAGKVNYVAGEEGATVNAGQLLASLDPENYSIAKDMADANLDQTKDEYNRLQKMYERKSIAESDFSKVTNALKVAQAQQRLQNKNLIDTKLVSPITGVLLKKGAETGEIIAAGIPLFVVSDINTVKVNVSIPESDLHFLKLHQQARVHISSSDSTFNGTVAEIGSVADPSARTFAVKIVVKNPQLLIRPGMTAEVEIITGCSIGKITVPADAVLHDVDNSTYVFIADIVRKQAFKRDIAIGQIYGNTIEVVSGLIDGDCIVAGGQHKLSNGSSIDVKGQP